MKAIVTLGLALSMLVALAVSPALAAEETLSGTILCAKCKLKKADAKECQDVLVVKAKDGATTEYYVAKNDVTEKFGHGCGKEASAVITGAISEKDGRKWITPSKMEKTDGAH